MRRRVGGWLRRQLATSVVVHTTDSQSYAGFLEEVAGDGVILRACKHVGADRQTDMAGEVYIPRNRVACVQVVRYENADPRG